MGNWMLSYRRRYVEYNSARRIDQALWCEEMENFAGIMAGEQLVYCGH